MFLDPTTPSLRAQRLFKHASDKAFALADRHVRYQTLAPNDFVMRHGDLNSPLVLVISGH